ncbi:hypothetical protein BJ875DRAFT_461254 [Amylocarpus encephaloides]|uniref:Uncharacterized protein n=1 Tax=Amylocarpus encephaloides TaxID=45428 RepID=A0A9P8C5G7_9HELO|nr:hypothetical protein BJ875DRAFT_461254 [Amylocarpus encephaloides]
MSIKMANIFLAVIYFLSIARLATTKIHHLFVGNLGLPASIYALEFDDQALTLVNTRNITADSSHAWIAFDVSFTSVPASYCPFLTSTIAQEEQCLRRITLRQTDIELLSPPECHTSS